MNIFIIHNAEFPLRKNFIDAQFQRYGIRDYEFINIESETEIMTAYINVFEKIARCTDIQFGVVIVDTILLTRKFLEYIYFAHLQMISSDSIHDVIFITPPNESLPNNNEKKMEMRINHISNWDISDIDITHSASFIVSKKAAGLIVRVNEINIRRGEYKTPNNCFKVRDPMTNKLIQTLKSVDFMIFSMIKTYSENFFVYWLK